jgi:hypothetical protein
MLCAPEIITIGYQKTQFDTYSLRQEAGMPIPEVRFSKNGGQLRAEVTFGSTHLGVYTLQLWESGSNDLFPIGEGNNDNPSDDEYPLPLPTAKNDGRLLDCIATVVSPDPEPNETYSICLDIFQGKKKKPIGSIIDEGDIGDDILNRRLLAKLIAR